jgi:hypothetical protein
MPPKRSIPAVDDSRSEASSTKEKHVNAGKNRRGGTGNTAGSSLRDVTSATAVSNPSNNGSNPTQDSHVSCARGQPFLL